MRRHHPTSRALGTTRTSIERELGSIRAAIELVATGEASRVSLTGMCLSAALVGEARRLAVARDVRVRDVWPMGDGNPDLIVEAAHGDRPAAHGS